MQDTPFILIIGRAYVLRILRSVQKQCEIDTVVDVELRLIESEGQFAIIAVNKETILVDLIPIAANAIDVHRQFLLVAALPVMTEKLASDAMVMAYPLPAGAILADPNVDTMAVRVAIGNAEVDRILALPLPDDIVALLS